jgi:hypothetical protein
VLLVYGGGSGGCLGRRVIGLLDLPLHGHMPV